MLVVCLFITKNVKSHKSCSTNVYIFEQLKIQNLDSVTDIRFFLYLMFDFGRSNYARFYIAFYLLKPT